MLYPNIVFYITLSSKLWILFLFTRDVRNGYMDFSENVYSHYYYSCSEGVHIEFSFGMDTIPLFYSLFPSFFGGGGGVFVFLKRKIFF